MGRFPEIGEMSRTLGLEPRVVRVRSAKASRGGPTPYGMFSVLYDGRRIVERPVGATRFMNIMLKRGTQRGMPKGFPAVSHARIGCGLRGYG